MKKIVLFSAGVLFGTAGMKLLGSKDATRAYAQTTAAALRAKDSVMTAVTAVREGADDVYAEAKAMMTKPMRWFCRKRGEKKFTPQSVAGLQAAAALKADDRNPYSWTMDFYEYPDGSGYEARCTKCGLCVLMRELGLYDLTPALCRLDYTMSEAGGTADFTRQYTLASGGPYCDCGYKKKIGKDVFYDSDNG